jgi:hypothetical protein
MEIIAHDIRVAQLRSKQNTNTYPHEDKGNNKEFSDGWKQLSAVMLIRIKMHGRGRQCRRDGPNAPARQASNPIVRDRISKAIRVNWWTAHPSLTDFVKINAMRQHLTSSRRM